MKITREREILTPFGRVTLPPIETPPLKLPQKPDQRATKVIRHGLAEDLAGVIGLIPWVGGIGEDILLDLHHVEIKKILTDKEYRRFEEYDKLLPTALALIRTLCFK